MAKLVELNEAAAALGVTPDELSEMRQRNEIFGYRDGSTWKFKQEEIDRVLQSRGDASGEGDLGPVSFDDDLDELIDVADLSRTEDDPSASDSVLISEKELGRSDEGTSSTIIGKDQPSDLGSNLNLEEGLKEPTVSKESDLTLGGSDILSLESGLLNADEGGTAAGSRNLAGAESSDLGLDATNVSGDRELQLEAVPKLDGELDLDIESALNLTESTEEVQSKSSVGSAVDLDREDDDLVQGTGAGSDVTLGASDSGINLMQPSDSGLSLEADSADLSGASVESLELAEDDMMTLGEDDLDLVLESESQADDEFQLTPVEDVIPDEESSDSGSQVIALDGEDFDDAADTMMADGAAPLLEEDVDLAEADREAVEEAAPSLIGATPLVTPTADEPTYSVGNVLSLFCVILVLGFTGILMMDLMKNIWSWEGTYSFSSAIMDSIIGILPG